MTRRPVRSSDYDPSMDEDSRLRARHSEQERWDEEMHAGPSGRGSPRVGDPYRAEARGAEGWDERRTHEDHAGYGTAQRTGGQRAAEVASAAEALSSVASWIERAQSQLGHGAEAPARSEASQRERRRDAGEGSIEEALAAIRQIEERLAAQPGSRTYTGQAGDGRTGDGWGHDRRGAHGAGSGFEPRADHVDAARAGRMPGRRPLKPGQQLRNVVDEIRTHQSRLEGDAPAPRRPTGLPALGTLARSQTAMLTTLRQEVAKLASRIEDFPRPEEPQVRHEVETLRHSMAEVARRDDLSRLEEGLQALSRDIMELRRSGDGSSVGHEIAALQAEIRHMAEHRGGSEIADLQAEIRRLTEARHEPDIAALRMEIRELADRRDAPDFAALAAEIRRLAEHRSGPDLSAIQAEIRHLSEQRPESVDIGPLTRDIQNLSRKLDRLVDSGIDPAAIVSISDQIEHVRQGLVEASAPQALDLVDRQLAAIRREIAEVGGRQVAPRDLDALRATVEDLRLSLVTLAGGPGPTDVERAIREFGQPIEATLASLVDKLERVERRVSDPEALDHLERQIQALAGRVGGGSSGRDPSVAALERSMVDLLSQVSSWREGTMEAAEHAARTAVAETLDAMPVAAEVERHLMEFGDRYAAAEERTRQSLSAVHSSLSDVMVRLASLEIGTPRAEAPRFPDPVAARPREPEPAPAPRSLRPEGRPAEPSFLPEADSPLAPPVEDEVLLEPGAGRPSGRPRGPAAAAPTAGEPARPSDETPDIKSSFIAAARRAAQAAAAESQAAPGPRSVAKASGASTPSDLLGRVRRLIDSKRRPLLLAAAAIVLALGTMQIVRTQMSRDAGAPSATVAVAPVMPAEIAPPKPEPGADLSSRRGETTAGTTPAPPPLPEPETTRSITPAPPPAEPPAAAAPPAQLAAVAGKDGARVGDVTALPAAVAARSPVPGDPGSGLPVGIRHAADRGNPVALYELGARTADGRGVARDPKAATGLFEKAAEKGLAPAQYRLGNSYERGIGVARDAERAKGWYRRAAEAGNVRAMHNLAVLLADGAGAKPDYAGAVEWFSRAAEHGVRDSQFNLAVLHARGLGTPQDLTRAYHWLAIAAQQGDEDAAKKRDEVAGRLAGADLGRVKAGVERWRATPATVAANEVLLPPGGFPEPTSSGKRPAREARL